MEGGGVVVCRYLLRPFSADAIGWKPLTAGWPLSTHGVAFHLYGTPLPLDGMPSPLAGVPSPPMAAPYSYGIPSPLYGMASHTLWDASSTVGLPLPPRISHHSLRIQMIYNCMLQYGRCEVS